MDFFTRRTFALLGIGGTAAACVVPWSHYAGLYTVLRLPLWGVWLATAAVLHAVSLLRLVRDAPWIRPAGVALGLATVAAALLVQRGYDDGAALHGPVVPLVRAHPGFGIALAALGAMFATGAAAVMERAASDGGPR
ncbi:hypothetical protein [Virgisporangium aliadipatigenens]|uniref:hypothetical protein n=1 Tax=Virgisporangium aliadipatigenens TaxID=741659 RepID=UPI001943CD60|nr:hypothetical protein [Virgisporangium aliadipatigenens]